MSAPDVIEHDAITESSARFWEQVPLPQMSAAQWEALCDGCGKCCLEKFEDDETGRIVYSQIACALLDIRTCRCRDYADRARQMPDCVTLTLETLQQPEWLPETCAYRRLAEGRTLPRWHPLLSGDPHSVVDAGESMRGRALAPRRGRDPLQFLIDWVS